jgi:hypothetical protein
MKVVYISYRSMKRQFFAQFICSHVQAVFEWRQKHENCDVVSYMLKVGCILWSLQFSDSEKEDPTARWSGNFTSSGA